MKKGKQIGFRLLSMMITLSLAFSCFCFAAVPAAADSLEESIYDAASAYVAATGNNATAAGLLSAVQAAEPTATLDTTNDYYFKHAVPGVVDNTSDYPLNIPGSDGALAAVFEVNGDRYPVAVPLAHETETIAITETAIVGTSTGFTYDENGNVTGYSGTANKIVLPADYNGTFLRITDQSSVDNVKVLIYNNKKYVHDYAFYDWDGLVAVQFKSGEAAWRLTGNGSNHNDTRGFASCDNLKYVRLPDIVSLSWYTYVLHNNMFDGCGKLENINHPTLNTSSNKATSWAAYNGTAIRDYVFPQYYTSGSNSSNPTFQQYSAASPTVPAATRNVHWYTDAMTTPRAVALAVSKGNELVRDGVTGSELTNGMLAAITGSADAAEVAATASLLSDGFTATDYGIKAKFYLAFGTDYFMFGLSFGKALADLTTDYPLTPAFDPMISSYSMLVPSHVTEVSVSATPVDGAILGNITGTTISGNATTVVIPVSNTDGQIISYTIAISKHSVLPNAVYEAANAYVQENKNTVTPEGLLEAVQTVWPGAALAQDGFYIKHATSGVKDNDTVSGYPLSIEGGKGSVTAIITNAGVNYTFNTSYGFGTEILDIGSYAIVGDSNFSDVFTYDASGNVTALKRAVEKIIFPAGYVGTMKQLTGKSLTYADSVKVVIYNNSTAFVSDAFSDWSGLIAFSMDNGTSSFLLGSAANNTREARMFKGCTALKYFKFPEVVNNSYYWNAMFPNSFFEGSTYLETVIMPKRATSGQFTQYGFRTFWGTAVRDVVMPQYGTPITSNGLEIFDSTTAVGGTRNFHPYHEAMTLTRAASLIGAGLSDAKTTDAAALVAFAKALVTGSSDAATFADALTYEWVADTVTNDAVTGRMLISDGTYEIYVKAVISKTLSGLAVLDGKIDDFLPTKHSCTVTLPYNTPEIVIDALAVTGAQVSCTTVAENGSMVTVSVVNSEGHMVNYEITVERTGIINAQTLTIISKALLMINHYDPIDVNADHQFDILDLIRAKKLSVEESETGMNLRLDDTILERSIVSAGNQARIANVMKKASRGEPVTIGVIGGSITYGVGASTSRSKYASLLKKWWESNFESSELTFVNAGLSATGSIIGVHRSPTDLLCHDPDLVVIDFSVNDGATDKAGQEGYESLVRRILKQENNPGVILLFLFDENGSTAQDLEKEIGDHYDLPMLSYRDAIWPVGGEKVYQWSELSGDNIHPNDVGHAIIGEIFGHYLNKVKANMDSIPTEIGTLPLPVTANRYENSSILKPSDITPTSLGGFVKSGDTWTVKNDSDPIVFELNSRVIHIMYKRTSNGTGGTVSVKINGETVGQINSDFSGNYTYNAISQIVAGASSQNYTVELSLTSASPKDSFTLLGILVSE